MHGNRHRGRSHSDDEALVTLVVMPVVGRKNVKSALGCIALALLASCNGDVDRLDANQDNEDGSSVAGVSESTDHGPQSLVGTIVEVRVDPDNGHVSGFALDSGQEVVDIQTPGNIDYGFNLHHLFEHQQTEDPVIVRTESSGASLVALSIEDYGS
jgi:hypothetical protein